MTSLPVLYKNNQPEEDSWLADFVVSSFESYERTFLYIIAKEKETARENT